MRYPLSLPLCLFLTLVFGITAPIVAQTSTVVGTVTTSDGEPLIGADVALIRAVAGTQEAWDATDREGRFELRRISDGAYDLVVRFVGFEEARTQITVHSDSSYTLQITMSQTDVVMEPVVITASRRPEKTLDAPASISVLSAQTLQRDPVPSPVATLRHVPGVDMPQEGINRYYVSIRGFTDSYTIRAHTLLDYRDMHNPAFSDALYLMMPLETIDLDRIEIVRGPNSALYGPGVDQGVVHFITKDPFDHPGTSVMLEGGQQEIFRGAVRHAGTVGNRFAYKVLGSYYRGVDWKFDRDDPHDASFLDSIADTLFDLDGRPVRPLGDRQYDAYTAFLSGEGRYRLDERSTVTANVAYSTAKNNFNGGGEWHLDGAPTAWAQVRLQSDRLFAQAYYHASLSNQDHFNYRTGFAGFNKSTELGLQAQYGLDFLDGRGDLTFGVDYVLGVPRTRGTITGRNERGDDFYTVGGYAQSSIRLDPKWDLLLSARLDYFSPVEENVVSPRAALIFKPTPEQSLRLTYNRASGLMRGLVYFMDVITDDLDFFKIRIRGAANPYTFQDPLRTSSFIVVPGLPPQDPGVGIAVQRAYAAATAGLTGPGGPLSTAPQELQALLWSKVPAISGFSSGQMLLGERPISSVIDRQPIKPPITNTVEVGYKGLVGGRVILGVDAYYTRKERFFGFQQITPMVLVPNTPTDLSAAVSTVFTDEELSIFGLNVQAVAQLYSAAGQQVAANPVGIVEASENTNLDTPPELLFVTGNFGEVDLFGADVSVEAALNDRLTAFLNYSWVNDNFFDEEELQEPGSGFTVSLNAPKNKVRFGVQYAVPDGLRFRGSFRYVESFEVVDDFYTGTVDSYSLIDLGCGYDLSKFMPGLQLDVTAQNLLDKKHREYIAAPKIGRLVTARVTYGF